METADVDRRARLRLAAQVLAALNHRNVRVDCAADETDNEEPLK
jgi:hypothetical protein